MKFHTTKEKTLFLTLNLSRFEILFDQVKSLLKVFLFEKITSQTIFCTLSFSIYSMYPYLPPISLDYLESKAKAFFFIACKLLQKFAFQFFP